MAKKAKAATVAPLSRRQRPTPDLGRAFRTAREAQGLSQAAVAKKAGFLVARVSRMELGHSVESVVFARVAIALGYRSAVEVFRAHDPLTTRFLRTWSAMDPRVQELALQKLRVWLED